MIPLFTPSAIEMSPFSTTALHIAHCALETMQVKTNKKVSAVFLLNIIWGYHYINDYATPFNQQNNNNNKTNQ